MQNNANQKKRTRLLIGYTKRVRNIFALGLLFTGVAVVADLIGPYLIGIILNEELVQGVGARDIPRYIRILVLYGAVILLSGGLRFVSMYYFQSTANRIAMLMQEDLFARVQRFPISYFDSLPAGKIVSRITTDTNDVKVLYQVVLAQLLNAAIYGVGVYGALLFLDPNLFLIALIPLPILIVVVIDYRKKSSRYNRDYRSAISDLNAGLNENIQGMEIIRAFNREEDTYREFDEVNREIQKQGMNMVRLESYSSYNMTATLQYVSLGAILLYFGYGSITGQFPVSIGLAYIFVDYMMKIFNQAQNAFQRLGELERANSAVDNVLSMLEREPVREGGEAASANGSSVRFDAVNFSYKKEEPVLRDVSFFVPEGMTAAFVGQTGSGKTTIMNLLLRYYDPGTGAVLVGERDMKSLSHKASRESMAIVLQDPFIFSGSLYDNITLYDRSVSKEKAAQALADVGGEPLLAGLSAGIDTVLTEKGGSLSAGERQLVSFARAIVRDPKILVLDEATANIDSQTESLIQRGMKTLTEGRTTLIIAHRLSTIRDADRIFVLQAGRIAESGTHDELVRLGGLYEEMIRSQTAGQKESA